MKTNLKTFSIGLLLFCGIVAAAGAIVHRATQKNLAGSDSSDLIPWRTDLESARHEATNANKPLLVEFMATWCPDCQAMKDETWTQPAIARGVLGYVPVQIDTDAHPDIAKKYGVESIPSVFVVDPKDEKIIKESRGAVLSPAEFLAWLK